MRREVNKSTEPTRNREGLRHVVVREGCRTVAVAASDAWEGLA